VFGREGSRNGVVQDVRARPKGGPRQGALRGYFKKIGVMASNTLTWLTDAIAILQVTTAAVAVLH
jgi:hypothetical protein